MILEMKDIQCPECPQPTAHMKVLLLVSEAQRHIIRQTSLTFWAFFNGRELLRPMWESVWGEHLLHFKNVTEYVMMGALIFNFIDFCCQILKKKCSSSFLQQLERCGPITVTIQLKVGHIKYSPSKTHTVEYFFLYYLSQSFAYSSS